MSDLLSRPDVAASARVGLPGTTPKVGMVTKARRRVAMFLASLTAFIGGTAVFGGVARAQEPTDPTGGAASDMLGDIQGWVTSYGVPLLFGLLLVGVLITVAVKYVRKGARAI